MLYQVYELQHAAFAPWRMVASQTQQILRNPLNPMAYTFGGRLLAAACDHFEHSTRRFGKPKFRLDQVTIDGRKVEVEEQIILRKTFGQLKYFSRAVERTDPAVLIVAPMSGHFATLLRHTVETLLPDHEVYITDWRDARDVPVFEGGFDLDDYIAYLIEFLQVLGPNTHVVAVCQSAVPVLAATALMAADNDPCTPSSITLMGGPIDTRRNPTDVIRFVQSQPLSWFDRHVITHVPPPHRGCMRRVYPGFLQLAGFMSMDIGRHIDAHWAIFQHLIAGDGESAAAKRAFYEEYRATMDLCAEYYLQTIKTVFHDHALPKGTMTWRGRKVVPAAITRTALMTVEAQRDDISPPGQTCAAHDLCTGLPADKRAHHLQPGVGHFGIFHGRRWAEEIAPRIRAFIRDHDTQPGTRSMAA